MRLSRTEDPLWWSDEYRATIVVMIRERAIGQDRVNSRRIGAFLADLPFGFLVAVIAAVAAASVFAVLWWQASTATTTAGF